MRPRPHRVVLAFTSVVVALLAAVPASALHWSNNGAFAPTSAYQGVATTFTFTLTNTASTSVDVYWLWIQFCWQVPSNLGYYFKPDDGTTVPIAGGAAYDCAGNIPVDQTTLGNCSVTIYMNGKATDDVARQTATWARAITVMKIPALQASVAANPNNGQANLEVTFSATVTGGLAPYIYAWTFGDGGTDYIFSPSHTYKQAGTYTVTLVVSDSHGNQKTATTTVTVTPPFFGGGAGSSGGLLILIGTVVAVIAAVAAVTIIVMRRRKTRPPVLPPGLEPPMPPS